MTLQCATGDLEVFVLLYTHRHGEDVSVFVSRAEAESAVLGIMREWIDELDDKKLVKECQRLLARCDYPAALRFWEEHIPEENFSIYTRTLVLPGLQP
jgi:hypothetical protein